MAKTIKTCDLSGNIAAFLFQKLNGDNVKLKTYAGYNVLVIVTDIEPQNLVYPEGWYYAKGCFRNKGNTTSGVYEEVIMIDSKGNDWADMAKYSTRN